MYLYNIYNLLTYTNNSVDAVEIIGDLYNLGNNWSLQQFYRDKKHAYFSPTIKKHTYIIMIVIAFKN